MSNWQLACAVVLVIGCTDPNDNQERVKNHVKNQQGDWPLKWEPIAKLTGRLKVYNGWLVLTAEGMVFVPDPKHEWVLK